MNTTQKLFTLFALASNFAPLAQASEYKTIVGGSQITVLPTDVVNYVGGGGDSYNAPQLQLQFENEVWSTAYLVPQTPANAITGIKTLKVSGDNSKWATVKITPKEEATAVGPTSVLVIPENSTGNYDVVVESSGDMTTWTPFVSQTVQSNTPSNFFRVRIVKK